MKSNYVEDILKKSLGSDELSIFNMHNYSLPEESYDDHQELNLDIIQQDKKKNFLRSKEDSSIENFILPFNSIEGIEMYYVDLLDDLEIITDLFINSNDKQSLTNILLKGLEELTKLVLAFQYLNINEVLFYEKSWQKWYKEYFNTLEQDKDFNNLISYSSCFNAPIYTSSIIEQFVD